MNTLAVHERISERVRSREERDRRIVWACGWCKGFAHWENKGGMFRMVHDEAPATAHEVLPFQVR